MKIASCIRHPTLDPSLRKIPDLSRFVPGHCLDYGTISWWHISLQDNLKLYSLISVESCTLLARESANPLNIILHYLSDPARMTEIGYQIFPIIMLNVFTRFLFAYFTKITLCLTLLGWALKKLDLQERLTLVCVSRPSHLSQNIWSSHKLKIWQNLFYVM